MEGSKEMIIRMSEEMYASLDSGIRQRFLSEKVIIPDQHKKLYETDMYYRELYKTYRTAKKDLEDYKYNKRHANNRSDSKQLSESKG